MFSVKYWDKANSSHQLPIDLLTFIIIKISYPFFISDELKTKRISMF